MLTSIASVLVKFILVASQHHDGEEGGKGRQLQIGNGKN